MSKFSICSFTYKFSFISYWLSGWLFQEIKYLIVTLPSIEMIMCFSSLFFLSTLYISHLDVLYLNERKKKKNLFSRWNQVSSRNAIGENILIWQKLNGGGETTKERVKLLFIQNRREFEKGEGTKGEGEGGGKERRRVKAEQYSCRKLNHILQK